MNEELQAAVIEELVDAVRAKVGDQHGDSRLYSAIFYAQQLAAALRTPKPQEK